MEGSDGLGTRHANDGVGALDEALARDGTPVARFVTASLGAVATESEVVEQLFLQADGAFADGDATAFARARLFAGARRKVAQLVEQRRRTPEASSPEATALSPLRLDDVRPTEREALLLRYVGGLSMADLAAAASVDEATARARVSRGLAFVCRLASEPPEPGAPELAGRRRAVEEALADVVDGLAADDVADFVADDDASRDLVHDAERVVGKLRAYEGGLHFDELKRRIRAACDAKRAERAAAAPRDVQDTVQAAADEPAARRNDEQSAERPDETTRAHETPTAPERTQGDVPADVAKGADAPALRQKKDEAAPAPSDGARRARWKRVGVVAAVAAAAIAAFVAGRSHDTTRYADSAWSGKLSSVSRAFGGGVGVERCSPDRAVCSRLEEGDDVPAGSTLRTDGQTRAIVELRDGTRVVLDRDSELLLDAAYPRRARLEHGSAVADVPELGASRARFDTPLGFVETESVKVSLLADAARTDAEVARGSIRLVDAAERGVAVHAGEVGRLEPGATPAVFPSASLGDRFGWTERAFAPEAAPEEAIRGLGELGAKRPGDDHEKKGLVSLTSHATRVRIVGNVARTEVEEEFTSSSDDVLEGVFRFPLPPDAQIERLALEVDGKLEEGAFVDRERASSIWRGAIVNAGGKKPVGEEIVWVRGPWRDPALLEWQRGGRFELRIYPIPKRASRKVLLAYTQVIAPSGGVRRYVYPLPYDPAGSTRIGRFDVDVEVRGNDPRAGVVARGYELRQQTLPDGVRQLSYGAAGFTPSGDLSVEYTLLDPGQEVTAWAYRPGPDESLGTASDAPHDDAAYVAIALHPKLPRSQDGLQRDFALVVDSSRSMFGERYRRATSIAESIAREMDRGDRVTVLACDSTCREAPSGLVLAGPEAARAVGEFLRGVTPEGGSDVAAAVQRGREALHDAPHGGARVVYIGDGTPTIGAVGPAFIRREIEAAVPRDAGTVTAVAVGADADVSTLTTLANAGGGVVVPYTPGQTLLDAAFALLGATYGTTLTDARVELPDGLVDVAPGALGTLRAGGETMLVARMNASQVTGTLTLRGELGGTPFEQRYPLRIEATTAKGNSFVPRLWAAGKIAELEQRPDAESRRSAIELSGRFHVASRYTSLLVLESAAMMHAFGLERAERSLSWAGDSVAESTTAEGEDRVLDADDGRGALAEKAPMTEESTGAAGLGVAPSPARRSRAAAEPMQEQEFARPSPAPAAPTTENKSKAASAHAYRDEELDAPGKKEGYAPPPPTATAPAGNLGTASGGGDALQPKDDMAGPPLMQSPFAPRPQHFGPRYIPMRKIWERVGRIVTPPLLPDRVTPEALAMAERDASGDDPSRESMKRLYTLSLLGGHLDRAADVAERWSAKDPLDPDALTARADVAAARGERELSIRILGSVVDVRPGDQKSVFRLARLFRWAGNPELSCRYSLAAAETRSSDPRLLSEAVRCARDLGQAPVASDLMSLADDATRRAAEVFLSAKPIDPSTLSGDLRLEATWDGGDDIDLSLLPPDGARVSWLGAPTRAVITARDVRSTSREGLALRGGAPGDYLVEVTRPSGHRGTVRGSVVVYAAGDRRVVPFELDGTSARVALLKITTRPRLVPL